MNKLGLGFQRRLKPNKVLELGKLDDICKYFEDTIVTRTLKIQYKLFTKKPNNWT